ncbi:MAG: hypothetical protein IIA66_02720 [Planctomycetes bacterium]|nr:hypothetical protein [Planctomycetota bacterium]
MAKRESDWTIILTGALLAFFLWFIGVSTPDMLEWAFGVVPMWLLIVLYSVFGLGAVALFFVAPRYLSPKMRAWRSLHRISSSLMVLRRAWTKFILTPVESQESVSLNTRVPDEETLRCRTAFAKSTLDEQTTDIAGKTVYERPLVVINFATYATIVRKLVTTLPRENQRIAFFTLLALPPWKFFNYEQLPEEVLGKVTIPEDIRSSLCLFTTTNQEWEKYTKSLRDLTHGNGQVPVSVQRCLVSLPDTGGWQNTGKAKKFLTHSSMEKQLRGWILVPAGKEGPSHLNLTALSGSQLEKAAKEIRALGDPIWAVQGELYAIAAAIDRSSYVILPPAKDPKISPSSFEAGGQRFEWLPLGDVFAMLFHRNPREAMWAKLEHTDYLHLFHILRCPDDFFMVRVMESDQEGSRAVSGVSGTASDDLKMVTLYYSDAGIDPKTFDFLMQASDYLVAKSVPVVQSPRGKE